MSINNDSAREQARRNTKELEPKRYIDGFMFDKDKAKDLPRSFVCEKHGEFNVKFEESPFSNRIMVNSICQDCLKEYDLILDEEEIKINKKNEEWKAELEEKKRTHYLLNSGVSKRYLDKSFDNYATETPEKQNALSKCKELCLTISEGKSPCNLILVGGVGTGKTHLANSMVKFLYDNDKDSERINLIDLVRSLKATWSKGSETTEQELINYYANLDLLIIDEVGVQFGSDTEKMFVFDVINSRYDNCLPTVIISNLDINGVKEIIGDRCVDRLREDGGKVVAFDWSSHR